MSLPKWLYLPDGKHNKIQEKRTPYSLQMQTHTMAARCDKPMKYDSMIAVILGWLAVTG